MSDERTGNRPRFDTVGLYVLYAPVDVDPDQTTTFRCLACPRGAERVPGTNVQQHAHDTHHQTSLHLFTSPQAMLDWLAEIE